MTNKKSLFVVLVSVIWILAIGSVFTQAPWGVLVELGQSNWIGIFWSTSLVLAASLLRTSRTKLLLDLGRRGSLVKQFLNVGVGALINAATPMRIGELARSFLLARQLRISFGFSTAAIAFERLTDVIVVMSVFLILAAPLISGESFLIIFALSSLAAALFLSLLLILLILQNKWILRALWRFTAIWSPRFALQLKQSFWTLVHGFQFFFRSSTSWVS